MQDLRSYTHLCTEMRQLPNWLWGWLHPEGYFPQSIIMRKWLNNIHMRWAPPQMPSHTGVGVCLKLGKIWFLENQNLTALERLAPYSFSQSTSMLWKDKGFPLPTCRIHGILTWYWFINPCQTFSAILLSFLSLRTITAILLRWLLLNLQHSQHYSHTGKRSAFAKALVLQLQSHHFLPCKRYMFFCYTSYSLYCSPFNPKGHLIYNPANNTPQEADNLCKVTTLWYERERERKEILQSSGST